MPWRRSWRYRPWRYRRYRFRRPRKTFRRRRYYKRRSWVRKFPFYKRKLKRLRIHEYQPVSIRKCNIKGLLCLFQTVESRISCNFDMYEDSIVPERLPGGGGFSIKALSLYSLYVENIHGHNIWTFPNTQYPLMRYLGCRLRLYQSRDADYVVTYSNTWPLESSLAMYNTMQPALHSMQKHKIIVPSKQTKPKKKPYIEKFIHPPTQMLNKWYFQKDLAKKPLLLLRTSCMSLDHYYIGSRQTSTNMTIRSLNFAVFQHRNWGIKNYDYSPTTIGTQRMFLYVSKEHTAISKTKCSRIILVTDTINNTPGQSYYDRFKTDTYEEQKFNLWKADLHKGNPFYHEYLHGDEIPWLSSMTPEQYYQGVKENKTPEGIDQHFIFQDIPLGIEVRYNPYIDKGNTNRTYFLPVKVQQSGWQAPSDTKLTNENLPLWIQQFGFPDFQKKLNIQHRIDTDYVLVIETTNTTPVKTPLIPLSYNFWEGKSPYEDGLNDFDKDKWYLCFQYQQEANNDICISGPGTPKIPNGIAVEAKLDYKFYFKWGGDLPPMSTNADPTEQPWYPVPNNFVPPNSLQNPTTAPQTFLYAFDERRGELTKTAAERIKKDWEPKDLSFLPTEPRFGEKISIQETQEETTSEEEEEEQNLFDLLQQQRQKQLKLRQRIITTLKKLQKLE
nr:MAG: ORF1 [TTV-like mini virus]